MVAVGVVAVGVYWAVLRLGENQVKQMQVARDSTKLQTLNSFRNRSSRTMTSVVDSFEDSTVEAGRPAVALYTDEYDIPKHKKNEEDPYSLASRRAPNFMYKIKILLAFFRLQT